MFPVTNMEEDYLLPRIASENDPLKVAVLISGSGSGLRSLLKHQEKSKTHKTNLILTDNSDAFGLIYAEKYNIASKIITLSNISNLETQRLIHEDLINKELIKFNIELVVLNGYMRILTSSFVDKWKGRIINIHPSLLPRFPGSNAHRDVIKSGVKESGCTVHLVDNGVDTGHILAQKKVTVQKEDTIKTLQEKIKKIEHRLYPQVIDDISIGKYHSKS